MTDYADILEGLNERFLKLNDFDQVQLLTHEPRSVQVTPLMYSLLVDYRKEDHGTLVNEIFTTLHRVCYAWSDPKKAEEMLQKHVTEIPNIVESDDRLNGRIPSGRAIVNFGRTGFALIDSKPFRVLDFHSIVNVKRGRIT